MLKGMEKGPGRKIVRIVQVITREIRGRRDPEARGLALVNELMG